VVWDGFLVFGEELYMAMCLALSSDVSEERVWRCTRYVKDTPLIAIDRLAAIIEGSPNPFIPLLHSGQTISIEVYRSMHLVKDGLTLIP
jgi:hypothetical protein